MNNKTKTNDEVMEKMYEGVEDSIIQDGIELRESVMYHKAKAMECEYKLCLKIIESINNTMFINGKYQRGDKRNISYCTKRMKKLSRMHDDMIKENFKTVVDSSTGKEGVVTILACHSDIEYPLVGSKGA